jgi:hypothetical protein
LRKIIAVAYYWLLLRTITPDTQYVIRPAGTGHIDNALLLGACPRIGVKKPVNQIIHQETGSNIT